MIQPKNNLEIGYLPFHGGNPVLHHRLDLIHLPFKSFFKRIHFLGRHFYPDLCRFQKSGFGSQKQHPFPSTGQKLTAEIYKKQPSTNQRTKVLPQSILLYTKAYAANREPQRGLGITGLSGLRIEEKRKRRAAAMATTKAKPMNEESSLLCNSILRCISSFSLSLAT
ncbi:hypothetical protein M5K25_005181 [Dendrobium thyrsiflorum]|uniref:Uncharacterized protein n=1 Tax=Dendrobium thyrsiflorum TaxID=117978 RepID=A0ABD0VGT6_DENTH